MKKLLICFCILLSSCSSVKTVDTVKLSSVISNVKNDLQNTNSIPIDDFTNWTIDERAKFDEIVSEQQCQTKMSNPLISVFNDSFVLTVNGSFTKSGQFGIAVSSTPSGSLNGSLSKSESQQISVPINFISLSSLPSFEFNKKLNLESVMITGSKSDDVLVKKELSNMISERDKFQNHIQFLINSYNSGFCLKNKFDNNSSFMTLKKG